MIEVARILFFAFVIFWNIFILLEEKPLEKVKYSERLEGFAIYRVDGKFVKYIDLR